MTEPELKAAGFNSYVQALRTVGGDAAFARLLAAVTPETRALLEKPPLPMLWLPVRHSVELDEQAPATLFGGNVERMVDVGREQFRKDLGTVYRIFVRVASPHYVAERAAQIYQTYVRGNGTMRLADKGDKWLSLVFEGVRTPSPGFYALRRGNVLGAIDATGARNARIEQAEGGDRQPQYTV